MAKIKRCWETEVGNKRRLLCNDDSVKKRQMVRSDVETHLQGCREAVIDNKRTSNINPNQIQYAMQSGRVKSIRCTRRQTGRRCWNAKIDRKVKRRIHGKYKTQIEPVEFPVCEDDPVGKKIDIMDAVDSSLTGCTTARFWYKGERKKKKERKVSDSFTMRRVGGLNSKDRRMAGTIMITGQARQTRCVQKTKRGEVPEELLALGG